MIELLERIKLLELLEYFVQINILFSSSIVVNAKNCTRQKFSKSVPVNRTVKKNTPLKRSNGFSSIIGVEWGFPPLLINNGYLIMLYTSTMKL